MRRYARIGLLMVGCAAVLVYQTRRLGLTVDETSHFAAAYSYWLGEDVLQPRGRTAAHPGDLRLGSPPVARAAASRHRRLERSRRLHDRRGNSRPSQHPRAPPAVLYPPAVPGLPPADRLPAVALGPPVVRRTGGALPRRVRRPGAHHSGSRRSDQLRRARRLRSLVVRLRGLEILAHPQCGPLADALARHAFRGARQVHAAAAGGRRVRIGPLERPAPSGRRSPSH